MLLIPSKEYPHLYRWHQGWAFSLIVLIVISDQWSKSWIVEILSWGSGFSVTDFFNIVRVHNTGAAFGMLAGEGGWQRIFFLSLTLLVSLMLIYLMRSSQTPLLALGLPFVLGGAWGNAIDRMWRGYVVDFLDFHYAGWHFWAFNIADSAITIGAVLWVMDMMWQIKKSSSPDPLASENTPSVSSK